MPVSDFPPDASRNPDQALNRIRPVIINTPPGQPAETATNKTQDPPKMMPASNISISKPNTYKLEPILLRSDQFPDISYDGTAATYDSFEKNQIYVSPELEAIYKREGIWPTILRYNDLLDERAANLVGYDTLFDQGALDYNYSKIYAIRNEIMASTAALDSKLPPFGSAQPGPPTDATTADDADAIVDFNKINTEIDTTDLEGVGTERASVVDPAEVSLFLNSDAEARREQQMFDNFNIGSKICKT